MFINMSIQNYIRITDISDIRLADNLYFILADISGHKLIEPFSSTDMYLQHFNSNNLYKLQIQPADFIEYGFIQAPQSKRIETTWKFYNEPTRTLVKYDYERFLLTISAGSLVADRIQHIIVFRGRCINKYDFDYILRCVGLLD